MVTADSGENAEVEPYTPDPGEFDAGDDTDPLGFPVGDGDYLDQDDFGEPPAIYSDPDTPAGPPHQDLDTPPEGSDQRPAGQAAAKAPAPDEYAWLEGLTHEQRRAAVAQRAQSDPDLILRGLMMHTDYTRKTSQLAEQSRALQALEAQLAASPPPTPATPPGPPGPVAPVVSPQDQDELVRWAEEFNSQNRRYPTPVEAQRYLAELAVKPVNDRVAFLEQTLQEQHQVAITARIGAQWRELETQYPEIAVNPAMDLEAEEARVYQIKSDVALGLQNMGPNGSQGAPGDVKRALMSVYAERILEGRAAAKTAARTAQAAAAAATPAAPPSTGGARAVPTNPPTSDIDQIARQQKRSPVGQRIQQAFGKKS